MGPLFRTLTDEGRNAIASTALDLLDRVGVRLTEPQARALLDGAGAHVEGDRIRIPAPLVEEAIQSAPSEIEVFSRGRTINVRGRTTNVRGRTNGRTTRHRNGDVRNVRGGKPAMRLGGTSAYFGAHTDAPDVRDPFTSERRPCHEADVRRNAALIDALANISYLTASGLVADRPPEIADRASLAQCLRNSTKPVLAMPVTLEALADSREMAALAVGGDDALRERPLMIVYAEPVSPLVHPDESLRKLLYCAEHRIPLVYTPYAAMGGTAPMSQAAIVAQACAESLSGLVVHQLKRPGAPFIFGGMPSVMDMKTTVFSYGAPEFQLGNTLMAEMAHHFDLPNFGTAGTSDAQTLDGQAILEATSSCLMAYLSGANLIHDVGLLGNATVVMPEMIVVTDEIIAMLRHLLRAVPVGEDALAFDVVAEVGPGGEFLTHSHTLRHFRDAWYPTLLYRGGAEAWQRSDRVSFEGRVKERTCELIESHRSESLPRDVIEGIQEILARAERAAG